MRILEPTHLGAISKFKEIADLKELSKITFLNKDYKDIKIENDAIIYLDPPYKGTAKYKNDIDHDELKGYIRDSHITIYVSGYTNVYNLNLVAEFNHHSSIATTNKNRGLIERLYCNKDLSSTQYKQEALF
jgi:site-specific DNA-adenine methylase